VSQSIEEVTNGWEWGESYCEGWWGEGEIVRSLDW
jgi:hypothetical protein